MERIIFYVLLGFLFAGPSLFAADTPVFRGGDSIELKDGTVIDGNIIAQNESQYYVDTGGKEPRRVDIADIKTIHFGAVVRTSSIDASPAPSGSPAPESSPGLTITL